MDEAPRAVSPGHGARISWPAAFTNALEKEGIEEVREWLRELIPGPARPREPEWWELPEPEPLPEVSAL